MPSLIEGLLRFDFPATWDVSQCDEWSYYRNQFQQCCGSNKAVDLLAIEKSNDSIRTLWLIEVKDYRQNDRTKTITLWDEIASKVRDTLSGLVAAGMNSAHEKQNFAKQALRSEKLRVVLHLEQAKTQMRGRRTIFNTADIQQKLKQTVKPINAHLLVLNKAAMRHVAWDASDADL